MANVGPATVTITSTTGPGQSVTAQKFTDIVSMTINFSANTVRLQGSNTALQYFDYSAIATMTVTISNGLTTVVIST